MTYIILTVKKIRCFSITEKDKDYILLLFLKKKKIKTYCYNICERVVVHTCISSCLAKSFETEKTESQIFTIHLSSVCFIKKYFLFKILFLYVNSNFLYY